MNNYEITKDSTKEEIAKCRELKKEFDSIRVKSYQNALEFWESKINWHIKYIQITGNTPHWEEHSFIDNPDIITIKPRDTNENIIFCKWYMKQYLNHFPKYNLELKVESIENSFRANNPKGFIEDEILKTNEYIDYHFLGKERTLGNGEKRKIAEQLVRVPKEIFNNYDQQGREIDWEIATTGNVERYVIAKFHSDYRKFLIEKLEELKNGKKSKTEFEENDIEENVPGKWNLRQRYLLLKETDKKIKELFNGNSISQTAKEKLIAALLNCDHRTARELLNQTRAYKFAKTDFSKVQIFKDSINLSKEE